MKQQENKEIDSLLRSWAGRRPAGGADMAGNGAGGHLDADELNSYAEGVLPPAARARYTAHLIDCDECRRMVSKLAVAAGPVVTERSIDPEPEPAAWRKALASVFAPPVLRFALPALLLVAVGVVFFASRPGVNERASVAQDTGQPAAKSGAAQPNAAQPGEVQTKASAQPTPAGQNGTYAFEAGKSQSVTSANSSVHAGDAPVSTDKLERGKLDREQEKQAQAPAEGRVAERKEPPREEYAPEVNKKRADEDLQPKTAASAPPPPPAKPATVGGAAGSEAPKGPAKDFGKGKGEYAAADSAEVHKDVSRNVKEMPAGQAEANARADDKRQKAKAMKAAEARDGADEDSETRTISGRHFQHRGSSWIDSAYRSSMAAVNVARGSEQYRALVADEPTIGTIANQLSGEIYLVWKGRAYHIK